jgi:hypothetical protein
MAKRKGAPVRNRGAPETRRVHGPNALISNERESSPERSDDDEELIVEAEAEAEAVARLRLPLLLGRAGMTVAVLHAEPGEQGSCGSCVLLTRCAPYPHHSRKGHGHTGHE